MREGGHRVLLLFADGVGLAPTSADNIEDGTRTVHTRNPVPLLAVGPAAPQFAGLTRIDQVAPRILDVLGAE